MTRMGISSMLGRSTTNTTTRTCLSPLTSIGQGHLSLPWLFGAVPNLTYGASQTKNLQSPYSLSSILCTQTSNIMSPQQDQSSQLWVWLFKILLLQFYSFTVVLCWFPLTLLVAIGEAFNLLIIAIFLSSDWLPSSSLVYDSFYPQTYRSSVDSLMSASVPHFHLFLLYSFALFPFSLLVCACQSRVYKNPYLLMYSPFLNYAI